MPSSPLGFGSAVDLGLLRSLVLLWMQLVVGLLQRVVVARTCFLAFTVILLYDSHFKRRYYGLVIRRSAIWASGKGHL